MDLQSLLGYSKNSPYANNPYLDIFTPEGLIDMSNTPIDLIGIDNLGNKKKMKAGRKNPYKFDGSVVREIPMQTGGNIYQQGGMSREQILSFLYEDDKEDEKSPATAPAQEEVQTQTQSQEQQVESPDEDYELALSIANQSGNPYEIPADEQLKGNPYKYVADLSQYGTAYKDIDKNVADATKELLARFPNLQLTSGRRSWGDKDAHPIGRAVDLSYDEEAFNYYQNVLVPKYGFNKALNPNHGTGKHIHLGYY